MQSTAVAIRIRETFVNIHFSSGTLNSEKSLGKRPFSEGVASLNCTRRLRNIFIGMILLSFSEAEFAPNEGRCQQNFSEFPAEFHSLLAKSRFAAHTVETLYTNSVQRHAFFIDSVCGHHG
jgi:hypothetical protein